jgi:hypothetical protein
VGKGNECICIQWHNQAATPLGQRSHAVGARLPTIDGNLGPHLFHYEKDDDDSDGANGNDVR